MVITTLEAKVAADQWPTLQKAFEKASTPLPAQIRESFLAQSAADADVWRIVTIWQSAEALEEYRQSVDVPEGVRMFQNAGAEPTLSRFAVKLQAASS